MRYNNYYETAYYPRRGRLLDYWIQLFDYIMNSLVRRKKPVNALHQWDTSTDKNDNVFFPNLDILQAQDF
jgi:hypothetical protein